MAEETDASEYDPTNPTPPEREPPIRSTAPQSDYTNRQVGVGLLVLLAAALLIIGATLTLA